MLDVAGSFISAEISNDIASLGATAGDRLPNIAEEQMSLGLSYRFEMFNSPAFARADFNYYEKVMQHLLKTEKTCLQAIHKSTLILVLK